MGIYDEHIESARVALAKAQAAYAEAEAALADSPHHVREQVLATRQNRIDQANMMIETFTRVND